MTKSKLPRRVSDALRIAAVLALSVGAIGAAAPAYAETPIDPTAGPASPAGSAEVGAPQQGAAEPAAGSSPSETADVPTPATSTDPVTSTGPVVTDATPAPAEPAVPPARAAAPGEAGEACLTGHLQQTSWSAEDKADATAAVRTAVVELVGATAAGGTRTTLATAATDEKGDFRVCAPHQTVYDAELRFPSHSDRPWLVVQDDTDAAVEHVFTAQARPTLTGAVDGGTVDVPKDLAGAWKIIDTVGLLWKIRGTDGPCWTGTERDAGSCTKLSFSWSSATEDGGWWALEGSKRVVLAGEDAQSQHTILHESGHWLQWMLHEKQFPVVTDCDPHYINKKSSVSCAWTEGWADAVAAWTLNDRRYVFGDGYSFPLEKPKGIAWPDGDVTQGNVGGALLDLWAHDGPGLTWTANIAALTGTAPPADFKEYYLTVRAAHGLPVDAATDAILARHGIVYKTSGPGGRPDGAGTGGTTTEGGTPATTGGGAPGPTTAGAAGHGRRTGSGEVRGPVELASTGGRATEPIVPMVAGALALLGALVVSGSALARRRRGTDTEHS